MAPGFGVRLNHCGENRIAVMSRLRQHFGLPLIEIKQVAAAVPLILASGESMKAAYDLAAEFKRLGADVEVYTSRPRDTKTTRLADDEHRV